MYYIIITILVVIDQIIKYFSLTSLKAVGSYPIIEGFFHLTYVENRGAAFGMLENRQWLFIIITSIVLLGIFLYLRKNIDKRLKLILSVVAAGAIGNLIDRIYHGFVVDMFDFRGIWQFVFNFADICVVLGGIALIVLLMVDSTLLDEEY